jgi:hypothetical protein
MGIQLKNNAVGYLATAISASDTNAVLQTGNGANFPTLIVGNYFYATLMNTGGAMEIVKVTARSGDSMTIVRAQESTSAQSFAAGSRFELRITAQSILDVAQRTDEVSVRDFGASSTATAAVNLAAFKAAVAATPVGGTLLIPSAPSFYSIDTAGGLSDAINVNKRMVIVVAGDVKANFSAIQSNPPYIFNVTADNVTFSGRGGKLMGDGTTNSVNAGTDQTFPGLVYVSGDNFTMEGCIVDTPPKVGVILHNCTGAKIVNNTFTGGPTAYTSTAYFAIRGYLGSGHIVSNNVFTPDANGGMYVNTIFFNGTSQSVIDSNVCIHPYEKLVYCVGSENVISNNQVIGNPNDIPGVSPALKGTLTSVYRLDGTNNVCVGNFSDFCAAGVTCLGHGGSIIADNMFLRNGQLGIVAFQVSGGYGVSISDVTITDNTMTFDSSMGFTTGVGAIQISASQSAASRITISDNKILGWDGTSASAGIYVVGTAAFKITDSVIRDNFIDSTINGVLLNYVERTAVVGNVMKGLSNVMVIQLTTGSENYIANNYCPTASSIVDNGYSTNSTYSGNQRTPAPLQGTFTMPVANNLSIAHGGVQVYAKVFIQPANAAAATLMGSSKALYVDIAVPNFRVLTADGTGAAGTEVFTYNIVQ